MVPFFWVPLARLSSGDRLWVEKKWHEVRILNSVISGDLPEKDVSRTGVLSPSTTGLIAVAAVVFLGLIGMTWKRAQVAMPLVMALGFMVATWMVMMVNPAAAQKTGDQKKTTQAMKHFEPFKEKLDLRTDGEFLYVGSNGLPDHPMMIGIQSWQQQVPLPQPYNGRNSWRIPLSPQLSNKPISAKTALFRGAIALAVNGVPIFNALNNRGDDTYLAGELDDYGGHCGRGDDYHYHIAPIHLEKTVGKGNPIAYALDGFPIYGFTDSEGKEPKDLDAFNGRMEADGYRYYSTRIFPYINGGMRGVVTVRGDQIEPQPKDSPVRPAGQPLRGARITGFEWDESKNSFKLEYDLKGKTNSVQYTINRDQSITFVYIDGNGRSNTQTYQRREPREEKGPQKKDRPRQKKGDPKPSRSGYSDNGYPAAKGFTLTSPEFEDGDSIPIAFTGDGEGVSPPLEWSGVPVGTKCFALQLWHQPGPDRPEIKSYWVLSNIPAGVHSLPRNVSGIGREGYNGKNRPGYDPMKSKGPGIKEYHITLYALSSEPKLSKEPFARGDLLEAIKDITLAETTLNYTYEREGNGGGLVWPIVGATLFAFLGLGVVGCFYFQRKKIS